MTTSQRIHEGRQSRRVALATMTAGLTLLATAVITGPASASSPTTIIVTHNKAWGRLLSLQNGDTLYRLTKDSTDKSVCTGKCATVWIPVVLASGQKTPVGVGVSHLGSFARANGVRQVTYEGIPLYTYTGDKKPGEVTGNVKDSWGQWWTLNPASPLTAPNKSGSSTTTTAPGTGIAY